MEIVGLHGRSGAGKTTAAKILQSEGYVEVSFAAPLKEIVHLILRKLGYSFEGINWFFPGDKDVIIPKLGVSVRHMLQTLGTEWGRKLIHPDLWVMIADQEIKEMGLDRVVISDVRHENEAVYVRNRGWAVIHLQSPNQPLSQEHESEQGIQFIDGVDRMVNNDKSLHELRDEILNCVECE